MVLYNHNSYINTIIIIIKSHVAEVILLLNNLYYIINIQLLKNSLKYDSK